MSNLVPKEGSEQGDVCDDPKDGDDAVEGDEGVVGAVRKPAGEGGIGTLSQLALISNRSRSQLLKVEVVRSHMICKKTVCDQARFSSLV